MDSLFGIRAISDYLTLTQSKKTLRATYLYQSRSRVVARIAFMKVLHGLRELSHAIGPAYRGLMQS